MHTHAYFLSHLDKIVDPKTKKVRTAFAVYQAPEPKAPLTSDMLLEIRKTNTSALSSLHPLRKFYHPHNANVKLPPLLSPPIPDPLRVLHADQIRKMDPTGARSAIIAKTRSSAKMGDVLMVTHRRGGEPFSGVLMGIHRAGIDSAIQLRNTLGKVGVEMWFKVYNKNVAGIEIIKRAAKRARRAKLTYLRQPKHDKGSVQGAVFEWKRGRGKTLSAKGAFIGEAIPQKKAKAKKGEDKKKKK